MAKRQRSNDTATLRSKLAPGTALAPRTLADRAFTAIHGGIISGAFEAGERLSIEELAASLDMSPMPVREALRRLDAVGLVEHIPHRGARVTELSLEDLVEVYQARLALEPLAVRRATEHLTDDTAEHAKATLAALGREGRRSADRWAAHTAFHFALYEAAGSHWLLRLIRPLWESSERYRVKIFAKGDVEMRHAEHEEILDAFLAGQADRAAILMHNHLASTANLLAHKMGARDVFPFQKVPKAKPGRVRAQ